MPHDVDGRVPQVKELARRAVVVRVGLLAVVFSTLVCVDQVESCAKTFAFAGQNDAANFGVFVCGYNLGGQLIEHVAADRIEPIRAIEPD